MDAPVYHLEKLLQEKDEEARDFIGPLDLMLHLLRKNKIEIKDISITQILDQYLHWMARRQALDLEVASEFVIMAAQLLYIKSRMLLSFEEDALQEEMDLLIADLEKRKQEALHSRLAVVLPQWERQYALGSNTFAAPGQLPPKAMYRHEPQELLRALARLNERNQPKLPPTMDSFRGIVGHEPYPLDRKALELQGRLRDDGVLRLQVLLQESESRSEVVAVFIVVLELCRGGRLRLEEMEGDWLLHPVKLEEHMAMGEMDYDLD